MKNISKLLLIILFTIATPDIIYSTISYLKKNTYNKIEAEWRFNYEASIWFIKQHEGFRGTEYKCPSGNPTIGYGHVIKSIDTIPEKITEKQADSILRSDFDQALKFLDKVPQLQGHKKLAIAHYIYAVGIGNFNRSTLKTCILENKPIDKEIVRFCYYRANNKLIKSNYALKMRKWELAMYNKDTTKRN